jgi:creatinine amidohydrolase
MDDLNWMEFQKLVPSKIKTVILTVGTLEAHGVLNNGADNTAPIALAHAIAEDVNALIAPHIPYGVTGILAPFPGGLHIPEEPFRVYVRAVLLGLVSNGFRNIIILNGHGAQQPGILSELATEIALDRKVNILVVNWWVLTSSVTTEVFGEDGGHAGNNETAMIQAIDRKLVHRELYTGKDMATTGPESDAWWATPFPSSIYLYKENQGLPTFDQAKADEYYKKVVAKVKALVQDTLHKWQMAGLNP